MQENNVYVKQRPHLYRFLERVVELFHVVIFTASHSIYASQLLDILDPDGKFVSQRFYRDSCILSEGIYTKDLTVLGLDLSKVAIIDNCPQVCSEGFISVPMLHLFLLFTPVFNKSLDLNVQRTIITVQDFVVSFSFTWTLIVIVSGVQIASK